MLNMKIVNGILIMSDLSCIIYLIENNPKDINTIIGCVSISKKLMEDLIRKVNRITKLLLSEPEDI